MTTNMITRIESLLITWVVIIGIYAVIWNMFSGSYPEVENYSILFTVAIHNVYWNLTHYKKNVQ